MDIQLKKDLDEIIKIAPMMAVLASPPVVMAAAFCTAQDMANQGDDEGALYLLKNHPRLGIAEQEPSDEEMGDFLKSLFED